MVMKLCTVIGLSNTAKTEVEIFVKCHRFHGNCLLKLTKKCLKASFLGRLKEYEGNTFDHVSNLLGNMYTRNKSAWFSCLEMEMRPLFRVFPLFKL